MRANSKCKTNQKIRTTPKRKPISKKKTTKKLETVQKMKTTTKLKRTTKIGTIPKVKVIPLDVEVAHVLFHLAQFLLKQYTTMNTTIRIEPYIEAEWSLKLWPTFNVVYHPIFQKMLV